MSQASQLIAAQYREAELIKRQYANAIYIVTSYGIYPDGNDYSALLNQLISSIPGGIIHFPAGTYIIGDTIRIKSDIVIQGSSVDATIIKLMNATNKTMLDASGSKNVTIRNLTVDGNSLNQTSGHGLWFHTASNFLIEDVKVINCKNNGISCWQDAKGIIDRCDVSYCGGSGIRTVFGASCLLIRNTVCSYCDESGILLEHAPYSLLDNCETHHCTAQGENSNGFSIQTDNVTLRECKAHDNYNYGIYITGANAIVDSCRLYSNTIGGLDLYNGNNLRSGFIIKNNYFTNNLGSGFTAFWAADLICSNNIIKGNSHDGIDFDGVQHCVIKENVISGNAYYGIKLRTSGSYQTTDMQVSDNDLSRNTQGTHLLTNVGRYLYLKNNIGQSPVGPITTPGVPVSNAELVNPFPHDVRMAIKGGTVTDIKINGISTGLSGGLLPLSTSESVILVYSVAPTWTWIGV
ncbi:right-handed parallel beta-helix repeat-containing protein [Paenibacillus polymyxa]|jgi:parallel beta-helix repeat protein|uniref:right-handed parallel beta-helix repeat-containing protein n=1 Tax=Paenibacillus polymyxa TaxID=1406 RepID=UPI00157FEAB9|nr:right-handed parallel beta-helix repeat-containing protein [Paenibacillus polymyxa]MBY0020725.1 right-handed parallel beta-helix repeat-containing protein [Paenibacillus polymyxa]MBY0059029.1 right-handed parallel beta-helix repeat-containing protein [Paenibacillus polymyxa]MBY0069616.1 right-handed parallel beta-helix repeat-containing protein [Paenibacillus polymyxa]MBY0078858.1 right-handed parallel beta-helix repeat-containing protein [Paenibacillus polymyxa]MBZ6441868.1 right-handed pa